MKLLQILEKPEFGYWDGGAKKEFEWSIEYTRHGEDKRGEFVRVGSWCANHWFHVALGKTEKLTLSYAKKHLKRITKVPCKFEYID